MYSRQLSIITKLFASLITILLIIRFTGATLLAFPLQDNTSINSSDHLRFARILTQNQYNLHLDKVINGTNLKVKELADIYGFQPINNGTAIVLQDDAEKGSIFASLVEPKSDILLKLQIIEREDNQLFIDRYGIDPAALKKYVLLQFEIKDSIFVVIVQPDISGMNEGTRIQLLGTNDAKQISIGDGNLIVKDISSFAPAQLILGGSPIPEVTVSQAISCLWDRLTSNFTWANVLCAIGDYVACVVGSGGAGLASCLITFKSLLPGGTCTDLIDFGICLSSDQIKPTVAFSAPTSNQEYSKGSTVLVRSTAYDASGLQSVVVNVVYTDNSSNTQRITTVADNGSVGKCQIVNTNATCATDWSTSVAKNGTQATIRINAIDTSGNQATQSINIRIGNTSQSETVNWPVTYQANWNKTGTITKPGASSIRVRFSAINTESGFDYLRSNSGNTWTGSHTNVYSNWQNGSSISLTMTSDGSVNGNFTIDRVEWTGASTSAATKTGEMFGSTPTTYSVSGNVIPSSCNSGVTMTFTRTNTSGTVPSSVVTGSSGSWTQSGFANNTTFRVTPSKQSITFTPAYRDYSATTSGLDFTCSTSSTSSSETVNWPVTYQANWNKTGTITKPGASSIRVRLSVINTESGFDYLRSNSGNTWTGSHTNVYSNWQNGSAISLTMTSDGSVNGNFTIDRVEWTGTSTSAATKTGEMFGSTPTTFSVSGNVTPSSCNSGVTMTFTRTNTSGTTPSSVVTGSSGSWAQSGFANNTTFRVTPSKQSTTFTPAYRDYSATTSGLNFTCSTSSTSSSETVNWPVVYYSNWNKTGTITKPGASSIRVRFSVINTESGFDYLRSNSGNTWTGSHTNVYSNWQNGSAISLTMTSDGSVNGNFTIDRVEWTGTSTSAATKTGEMFGSDNSTSSYESVNWTVTYLANWNKTGTITKPGASSIRVRFSIINTESGFDYLRSNSGNAWTGSHTNVYSNWQNGSAISLTMTSDGSVNGNFTIDRVEWTGTSLGQSTKSGILFQ